MKNAIVVNMGDIISKISNNLIKATKHRVLDIGKERFSMPYFMSPKHSARISPMHLQSNRESCEDASYEKDQANKKEMDQLISFG